MSRSGLPEAIEDGGKGKLYDSDYPADPYPGARPDCSFLHCAGGVAHRLHPAGPGNWLIGGQSLEEWLHRRGAPGLAARLPVLAYGSNACPSKITWLRYEFGLTGPVPVLRCRTSGVAAVWSAGIRRHDGQSPAVLAAAPGRAETHAVWLATPEQLTVLDSCEGRGLRYDLVHLDGDVEVRSEDGSVVPRPLAYVTCGEERAPLVHEGRFVSIFEVDQAGVRHLVERGAVPGPHDGFCGLTVEPYHKP
jgi:hypothetical protein